MYVEAWSTNYWNDHLFDQDWKFTACKKLLQFDTNGKQLPPEDGWKELLPSVSSEHYNKALGIYTEEMTTLLGKTDWPLLEERKV